MNILPQARRMSLRCSGIEDEMQLLRRYALYLQGVMAAASEGQGGVAESFETVDDVLGRYKK